MIKSIALVSAATMDKPMPPPGDILAAEEISRAVLCWSLPNHRPSR